MNFIEAIRELYNDHAIAITRKGFGRIETNGEDLLYTGDDDNVDLYAPSMDDILAADWYVYTDVPKCKTCHQELK
jgi:hypothetical protein